MKASELKQIIREEYEKVIAEAPTINMRAPVSNQAKSRALSVVSTTDIRKFDTSIVNMAEDLMSDGFDQDDILNFLINRIEKIRSFNFSRIPAL
jgi:hypothetical protein